MSTGPYAIEGLFAICAGVLTIAKGEAWIGPWLPPAFVVKGPASLLIGAVAIGLGMFLLLAK